MALNDFFTDEEMKTLSKKTTGLTRKVKQDKKETRKVSLKAYDEKREDLSSREKQVLLGVIGFKRHRDRWPTANELKDFLIDQRDDWNSFTQSKSRVTELKNKGELVEHDKKECDITGMTAWQVKPARHLRRDL